MTTTIPAASISAEDLLAEIVQDTLRLKYYRDNFRYLYASDRTNIDVLNAAGPGFFRAMQQMMFDDAILRVAKLMDHAGNKHQENVSFERLLVATGWQTNDPAKWQKYRAELDTVKITCQPCITHRHKRISHKDLVTHQNKSVLPAATLKMLDDASMAIQNFVGAMWSELHRDSSYSFDTILNGERDVEHLMLHLRNRASQKNPDAVSTIVSAPGRIFVDCAFCGEKDNKIALFTNDAGAFRRVIRRHYDLCHGVIGCEMITVELVDHVNGDQAKRFTLDLRIPTHQTR